jgi:hypothetical protein
VLPELEALDLAATLPAWTAPSSWSRAGMIRSRPPRSGWDCQPIHEECAVMTTSEISSGRDASDVLGCLLR